MTGVGSEALVGGGPAGDRQVNAGCGVGKACHGGVMSAAPESPAGPPQGESSLPRLSASAPCIRGLRQGSGKA